MNFGIIADGNRRWAKENNVSIPEGHKNGFMAIKNEILPVLQNSKNFNTCTIYAFSTENWKRSPLEVGNLMKLFGELLDGFQEEVIKNDFKIIHAGRKDRIPKSLLKKLQNLEKLTESNEQLKIYLCVDYGGRDEIIRAAQSADSANNLEKFLEIPDLDIIFRTGGENRLSNFCIWQAAYAEFFFEKKFLPDVKKIDTEKVITSFEDRNRRKGK
ncbi:MAG: polyprenyl diphosphate synthase [Candidatus Peregrinibacteria bacterium]|nr:polyprenyl diphosphate synthase [Candidatus Peregrinibacteria bacterium]